MVKKIKLIVIFVASIIVVLILLNLNFGKVVHNVYSTNLIPSGAVTLATSFIQENIAEENYKIGDLSFYMSTYDRNNTNNNLFEIYINEEKLYEYNFNSKDVKDNAYFTIRNININVKKNDNIKYVISSPDGVSENSITLWIATDVNDFDLSMTDSNSENIISDLEGSLVYNVKENRTFYESLHDKYDSYIFFVYLIILSLIIIINMTINILWILAKDAYLSAVNIYKDLKKKINK